MTRRARVITGAILAAIALGSSVFAACLYAILGASEWRYGGLILLFGASIAAVLLAIAIAAVRCNWQSAVWLALASCTAASAVFANCRSACGNRVMTESKSPGAQWTATWRLVGGCAVTAGPCPPVSYVCIRRASSAMDVPLLKVPGDGIQLIWNSGDDLTVAYHPAPGAVRYRDRVGTLRVRYLPVGFM